MDLAILNPFRSGNNVNLDEELKRLDGTTEALFAREGDIKNQLKDEERDPGKKRKREVENWLKNVEEVRNRKRCLETDVEERRYEDKKLKGQAEQLNREIKELLEQGKFPNGVTLPDHSCSSVPLVTTPLKGEQFEKNLRQILSWCDDGVSMIGVWGVGGVGKTTLVTHVHNELQKKLRTCGNVYWVTVSHGVTTFNLQGKIAKAMCLDYLLKEEDQRLRAAKLVAALKEKENSMLILDDVWEDFLVEDVGIPVGVNGCQLILTSRCFEVYRRMECKKTIKMECLSVEESWQLFKEKLGSCYEELSSVAVDIAKLIAKECAGLPLAVAVVAASMRGLVDIYEWKNALEELQKPTRQHEDMDKRVLLLLQSSYDRLTDEQLKSCFLHCALYDEDHVFVRDILVDSWIRDGLIENIENRQKQCDKGRTMIKRLLEACLLEIAEDDYPFLEVVDKQYCPLKMHDVVRDMALKVARDQNHHFMIRAGERLRDLPCEKEWSEDLDKISLIHNEMSSLQQTYPPRCPNLQTFLLQGNPRLWLISDSFFQHMKGLMFIDFSDCKMIKRLPESISDLENLRALVLSSCWELEYVPSLAKLRKLKELDLQGCCRLGIAPHGIEELVNLRYLNIKDSNLVLRWDHLCSKLSNLEDLRLKPSLNNIPVKDLMKLDKLESLEGWWTRDIQDFNRYVKSLRHHQLKYYVVYVGPKVYGYLSAFPPRRMLIEGCGLDGELPVFPCNLEDLQMLSCHFRAAGSLALDFVPSLHGLTELKNIYIYNCKGIESIQSRSPRALQSLETLYLYTMENLKALLTGGVLLNNLRQLRISECHEIKQIFCSNQLLLPNLASICIKDCRAVEEIFSESSCDDKNNSVKIVNLPKLTCLDLQRLPRLRSTCGEGLLMSCENVEGIAIEDCWNLKTLPLLLPSPPPVVMIRVDRRLWDSLQWDWEGNNSATKHALEPCLEYYEMIQRCNRKGHIS